MFNLIKNYLNFKNFKINGRISLKNTRTKVILIFVIIMCVALFIVGIIQSIVILNLNNKQNMLNDDLKQAEEMYDFSQKDDYIEAFIREEGYGYTGEKIFETK